MSLYGSRVINIEKIWLPIPGEGRQVAVKIKLRLTATPDDPVKGKFFAAFNEQVLEADTQKELKQKLRAAAAATGSTRWCRFVEADLEDEPSDILVAAQKVRQIKPEVRTRRKSYNGRDGEFQATCGVVTERHRGDNRVFLPSTPEVLRELWKIQQGLKADQTKRLSQLRALAKRHAATPAPVYVEPTAPPEKKP